MIAARKICEAAQIKLGALMVSKTEIVYLEFIPILCLCMLLFHVQVTFQGESIALFFPFLFLFYFLIPFVVLKFCHYLLILYLWNQWNIYLLYFHSSYILG